MSTTVSNTIDVKAQQKISPSPFFKKLYPIGNASSYTVTATGVQDVTYNLPAGMAYNLGDSVFNFTGSEAKTDATVTWTTLDGIGFIDTITLRRQSGEILGQIRHFPQYSKVLCPRECKYEDYIKKGSLDLYYPSNKMASQIDGKVTDAGTYPSTTTSPASVMSTNLRQDNTSGTTNYTENQHLVCSTSAGALTSGLAGVQMSFGYYCADTPMGVRKYIYSPEILELVITFGYNNKAFWTSVSTTDPTSTALAGTSDLTISNPVIYLMIDKNPMTTATLKSAVDNGTFEMAVPWLIQQKQTFATGTSTPVVETTIKPSQGSILQKIFHFPTHYTETASTVMHNGNVSNAKITSYQTRLEGNPSRPTDTNEQDAVVSCGSTDWMINRAYLKDSCIFNQDQFKWNWCHVSDYTEGATSASAGDEKYNVTSGIPIINDMKFIFDATCPSALQQHHYTFAVVQRRLRISRSAGVQLL